MSSFYNCDNCKNEFWGIGKLCKGCEIAELKKLKEYTEHKGDCNRHPINLGYYGSEAKCTCGLDDLLKQND